MKTEEQRPHELRHLVGAGAARRVGGEVGLHVERGDHAEDDREDAADEHREEVVHARAAAPQAVDALDLERERREHGHERQHVQVLLDRRIALRHRDEAALEADAIGEHERPHREQGVGDDVERDEQAVVALYHRRPAGLASVSSITARSCAACCSRENPSACARIRDGVEASSASAARSVSASDVGRRLGEEQAGLAVLDGLERAAAGERHDRACRTPAPRAGRCRSLLRRAGSTTRAARYSSRSVSSLTRPRKVTPSPACRCEPLAVRPVAGDAQRQPRQRAGLDGAVHPLVRDERRHDQRGSGSGRRGAGRTGMEERRVDRGIHNRRITIVVSLDPPRNMARVGHEAVHARRRGRVPARQPRQQRAVDTSGSSAARPAPARSTPRTDPTRSASASGSRRCGGPAPAPPPPWRRSGSS